MQAVLRGHQFKIFCSIFVGYGMYILCRKVVQFLIPYMIEDGFTKEHIGLFTSAFNSAYAVSKFAIGVVSDRASSRRLFAFGLFGSSLTVVAFSRSGHVTLLAALWFANGLLQGCGWPAATKLIQTWFHPNQFGTYWSLLSASMNVVGTSVPMLVPLLSGHLGGWRGFMLASGLLSLICAVICLFTITDSPSHVGIDGFDDSGSSKRSEDVTKSARHAGYAFVLKEGTWTDLISSPFLWLVSLCYFVIFGGKATFETWAQLLIVQEKELSNAAAAQFLSSFEAGGFASSVVTGALTDFAAANARVATGVPANPRLPVALAYNLCVASMLHFIVISNTPWILNFAAFLAGSAIYGNIAIFGIVSTEAAPKHLSGTSHAIAALLANCGAIVAGWPASQLAQSHGLSAIFLACKVAALIGSLLLLIALRVPGKILVSADQRTLSDDDTKSKAD